MPATEAMDGTEERELLSYELAFHVLPTVAEGEVVEVFDKIKALITKEGGEITNEEAPARFDLAYEIVKYLEGRNRKFSSAYFGWVRFKCSPDKVAELTEEIEAMKELLRSIVIRLTKVEEENPFEFHSAIDSPVVETIDVDEILKEAEEAEDDSSEDEVDGETEEDGDEDEKAV